MTLLAEVADIQTGPFGSQLHKKDYVASGRPIVTVEHLGKRAFTRQNLPFVSEFDAERLKKYQMKHGDVIFSRVGSVDRCSYAEKRNEDGSSLVVVFVLDLKSQSILSSCITTSLQKR